MAMRTGQLELIFARVRLESSGDFAALLAIYEQALPARERKDASTLRAMCASADYRVVVAKKADEVVGFFILFVGQSVALLEYMAVRSGLRGGRFGTALYRRAREEAGAGVPLLMEIDSDREDAPDREVRARRKLFYGRRGCRVIEGLDYVLPLPGEGAPVLMDLLVDGAERDVLPQAIVSAWLREIYTRVYACTPDDPRLLTMIKSLPSSVLLT